MAKTIKFNLICDEKPVRTIEDLQNNFSVEDVLAYYENKLLHRWLKVRGYKTELEAVSKITSDKPIEIIKELIGIFHVTADANEIEKSIYMLKYLEERKERCAVYEQEKYNMNQIIKDYEEGYRQLVKGILDHPNDIAVIKANIIEIVSNYSWVLKLNHRDLFWELRDKSILAIMCLLMNDEVRSYYLPETYTSPEGEVSRDIEYNKDKKEMFSEICRLVQNHTSLEIELGQNLIVFSGMTDGYWKDLEEKGKRFMIISMESGDYVRSAGKSGGDLSYIDIADKFVILDGIDYKSNSDVDKLLYMEV